MATIANLFVELNLRTANFNNQIRAVNKELNEFDKTVKPLSDRLKGFGDTATQMGKALTVGVTAPILAVAGLGIAFNAMEEQAQIAFTTMLGSGQRAKIFLDDLKNFAAKTPFEFPDLVRAAQRLMAMGFASNEVKPLLIAVGNAVAGLGGGAAEINRVTLALGQMQGRGRVATQEMNQLTEVGIPAWAILAQNFGISEMKLRSMVEKGLVPADKAVTALVEGMNARFPDMMEKQSRTFSGLLSTIKDEARFLAGDLTTGLFNALKGPAEAFANTLHMMRTSMAGWSNETKAAIVIVAGIAAALGPLLLVFGQLALGLNQTILIGGHLAILAGKLGITTAGVTGLAASIGGPLAIALGALGLAAIIIEVLGLREAIIDLAGDVLVLAKAFASDAWSVFGNELKNIKDIISDLVNSPPVQALLSVIKFMAKFQFAQMKQGGAIAGALMGVQPDEESMLPGGFDPKSPSVSKMGEVYAEIFKNQKTHVTHIENVTAAKEKLSAVEKTALRIEEEERDEINKIGIALMNAEAAWMQYNKTMSDMPSLETLRNLETINEIIERNERTLQNSPLSTGRIPLAQLPVPLDFGPIPTADRNIPGLPQHPPKTIEEQTKAQLDAIEKVKKAQKDAYEDIHRSAGKVFDEIFLRKSEKASGAGILSAIDAELSKAEKLKDLRESIGGQQTEIAKEERAIADSQMEIASQEKLIQQLSQKRLLSAADKKNIAEAEKIIQKETRDIEAHREAIALRRSKIGEIQEQIETRGILTADQQIAKLREQGIVLTQNQEKWYRMALAEEQMAEQLKLNKAIDEYAEAHRSALHKTFDTIKKALEGGVLSLGRSIFQDITATLFGPLKKAFDDFFKEHVMSHVTGFLSGLFGNKATDAAKSAAQSAAKTATDVATDAGGGIGGAVSGAVSGAGGLTAGLISAAGGIIGGGLAALGTMRLEGTMNAVEYNTRASMIHLSVIIDQLLWPLLGHTLAIREDMHVATTQLDAIFNAINAATGPTIASRVTSAATAAPNGNGITINIGPVMTNDPQEFAAKLDEVIMTGKWGYRERWTLAFSQNLGVVSTVPAG